jgi:hypothetical protein
VGLVVLTPAVLALTRSAQQTGDGLLYAYAVKTGEELFHPHHLAYAPVVRSVWLTLGAALPKWDAVAAAQFHGIVWATIAVVFFYLTAQRAVSWTAAAMAGALGLLTGQGFWMLSTHAIPYVPAVGCLAAAVYLLTRRSPRPPEARALLGASLLWGVSILYHQANVLFAVPLLVYLRGVGAAPLRGAMARAFLPAGALTASAYVAAVMVGPRASIGEMVRFPFDYALFPNPSWGTFDHLGPAGLLSWLTNLAWSLVAIPRSLGSALAAGVTLIVCGVLIWNIRQVRVGASRSQLRSLLLTWVGVYLVFFLWWLPDHKPLFVLTVFPIVLLGLMTFVDLAISTGYFRVGRARSACIAFGAVALLGTFHLFVVILPLHSTLRPTYFEARALNERVDPSCYVMASYEVAQTLRYHFDRPRSTHARFPLLCIYQDEPIPDDLDIRDGECVVIAASYLRPDGRFLGFDGYTAPDRFRGFLGWLFDVRENAVLDHAAVRSIPTDTTGSYLAIGPQREAHDDWASFLTDLDTVASWDDRPFAKWLQRNTPPSPRDRSFGADD